MPTTLRAAVRPWQLRMRTQTELKQLARSGWRRGVRCRKGSSPRRIPHPPRPHRPAQSQRRARGRGAREGAVGPEVLEEFVLAGGEVGGGGISSGPPVPFRPKLPIEEECWTHHSASSCARPWRPTLTHRRSIRPPVLPNRFEALERVCPGLQEPKQTELRAAVGFGFGQQDH